LDKLLLRKYGKDLEKTKKKTGSYNERRNRGEKVWEAVIVPARGLEFGDPVFFWKNEYKRERLVRERNW